MSALNDALAELAALTAKVAALSGDDEPEKPTWNWAQREENIRAGVVVNDGVLLAKLRSGQIKHDDPIVLAAVAADEKAERRADRTARARAEVQRRHGKGTATGEPRAEYERGREEARRRHGSRAA